MLPEAQSSDSHDSPAQTGRAPEEVCWYSCTTDASSANPVHRLLSQGYKVGIVEQTETAALKKISDNRNELFEREVTRLYTAATWVHSSVTVGRS